MVSVLTSACLAQGGRTPEDCCLLGCSWGLWRGESVNTFGVHCRMVRSSVAMVGASRAGAQVGDEGKFGAGSSHATQVKLRALCLCIFGGGVRDMGARRGEVVVGGDNTIR